MVRSLMSGVSGLKNHQLRMDVIADNIANVNTVGFKASRVVFKDFFSQTIRSSSNPVGFQGGAPGTGMGGTNAMQVGLGVNIGTIDIMFGGATSGQRTELGTDFMIEGDGFFVVRDYRNVAARDFQEYYTRAGNFYVDSLGNLVTNDGMRVVWAPTDPDYDGTDPAAGPFLGMDNIGDDANPIWVFRDGGAFQPVNLKFNPNDGTFNEKYDRVVIDKDGTVRGFGSKFVGEDAGGTEGGNIPENGVVLGKIILANFTNPNGLERAGGNNYVSNNNTGFDGTYYEAGGYGGSGKILQGILEMSNVDLAREFADMIVTQRGFQANSRIITVSDTMVEELVNLKR